MPTNLSRNVFAVWWSGRAMLAKFTLDRFMVGVLLIVVFAAAACMGVQSDAWWHLRTGQLIVQTGQVWTVDPFSATARGAYWPNHEWLSQVLFYACYTLGGLPLLLLVCAALVTLSWYGIYLLCDGPPRLRAMILLLGVASHEVIWSVRPHIFSLALLVAVLLLLPGRRRHWLYPPLFLLWANTHAGVAFGGVVLAIACLVALVRKRTDSRHWLVVSGLSALATIANPLGLGLWSYVLGSLDDVTRAYLREWQPPGLDWPASYPFFLLVIGWVVAILYSRKAWDDHRDWTLLLLSFFFVLLGFRSIRHTAFFAVVALPLMTRPFRTAIMGAPGAVVQGALHSALILALALGCGLVIRRTWASSLERPPLASGAVAAVRSCDGPLFNTYDMGGPLLWFVPERAVFVDNRQDPYPADLLFQAAFAEQHGDYQDLFQVYRIRCALVPVEKPIYSALRQDAEWQEIYHDAQFAVLRQHTGTPDIAR